MRTTKNKDLLSAKDLDLIVEEFSKSGQEDYDTIRNVLKLCPKRLSVQFALDSCNSIRHLMKDERSIAALDAVQDYLDTGKPVPREIKDAAAAAYASAYAAAAAAAAASASAAYAYAAASASADAAASASASAAASASARNTPDWKQAKAEKMREHLNRLKELVLSHVPAGYDNFLLQVAL
jgi:hypothetical protein